MFVVGAIILWVVPVFLTHAMGKPKNRAGIAYGLFLGWVGVIVLALLPPREPDLGDEGTCPFCAERIKLAASVCKHCGRAVTPNPEAI